MSEEDKKGLKKKKFEYAFTAKKNTDRVGTYYVTTIKKVPYVSKKDFDKDTIFSVKPYKVTEVHERIPASQFLMLKRSFPLLTKINPKWAPIFSGHHPGSA